MLALDMSHHNFHVYLTSRVEVGNGEEINFHPFEYCYVDGAHVVTLNNERNKFQMFLNRQEIVMHQKCCLLVVCTQKLEGFNV